MTKFKLPLNIYFFATNNSLIHRWVKFLNEFYTNDPFGYFLSLSNIKSKKLKFIKKTSNCFFDFKLHKEYVVFVNYNCFYKKLLKNSQTKIILLFENRLDNMIYIFELF